MRRYAPHYAAATNTWSVIFNDAGDGEWYDLDVTTPDPDTAWTIVNALNKE